MRRLRRLLRWLLLSAMLILVLPVAMLALLATESGTAWTLEQVSDLARPQGIEFGFRGSRGSFLQRLELDDLVLVVAESRFEAERLLLQWRPTALFGRRLHIRALEVAGARLVPPPPTDSAAAPPEIPELVLPLVIELDRLLVERLVVEQPGADIEVSRFTLAARLDRQGLAVSDLYYEGGGAQLQGRLNMQASAPHALGGELSARIDQALTGDDVGTVEARTALSGTALSPAFDLAVSTPTPLNLRGVLKLDQVQPTFDLSADWPGLSWPLQGAATVNTGAGQLALKGVADDYRLQIGTVISGEGIPASDIDLVATGDLGGIRLQPLKVGVLDGRLQAEGEVRWDQGVVWDLRLLAEQVNPGLYLSDWPGKLDGRIGLGGSLAADSGELAMRARIHELAGRLRDYPVGASGSLDYSSGLLHAQGFEFTSGSNRIKLDGRAGERLDLDFAVRAPDLDALYPGLSGALEGTGQLRGTQQAPVVVTRLSGQAVSYQDIRAQELTLELDWRETGGKGQLQLSGVDAGGFEVTRLSVDLDGSPESHRLNLAAESAAGSLEFGAQGGLQQQVWKGELQQLNLVEPSLGEWLLQAPARLRLGADGASTSQLCLAQATTAACAEGTWDAAKGLDFAGSLVGLDLARLAQQLPGEAVIEGRLRGEFRVTGTTTRPDVRFELIPGDGLIRAEEGEEPIELAYRNARVSGRFENDRGSAELGFDLGPNGRAQGRIELGQDRDGQRSLGGEIDADFPDLALVAGFVPVLEQVQGRLHLEAALGGTLAEPRLTGLLEIVDARAQLTATGIELRGVELAVAGAADGPLRVRGQLSSGDGRIDISGTVDVAARGGPAVDLTLAGENFQAVQLPEATVRVSPDLRLNGAGPYHLSGRLLIPRAAIELKEVPSGTVDVSGDEIIIGETANEQGAKGAQNLTARVRIELGDAVTFKGFGLETGLTGVLDATVDAQGTGVDGKIELSDGEYKAYGQDLTVERGRLLFAGPPGNPEVDLRAVRVSNNGEVKAYLAMNGPLSKPRPRIYSEPALPETEALAYLVTGKGLGSAEQGDGPNLGAAALALGLSEADPVLAALTSGLGLDEISVETGEGGLEDSSVVLGKYLNPDLYIGYSQGLFNPEGAVLMRLQLLENLSVESRSGNEQSVDLFYRVEHD